MKVLVIHCTYQHKGGEDTVVDAEIRLLRSKGVIVETLFFSNEQDARAKILQLPFNVHSFRATKNKIHSFKPDIVHIHNLHFAGTLSVFHAVQRCKVPFVTTLHNYRLVCPSGILFNRGAAFTTSLRQRFPWSAVFKGVYRDSRWLTFWVALSMALHKGLGTLQLCNRYIVLSDQAKELFLASGLKLREGQLAVKQNFCDHAILEIQEEKDYFLYVGRLSEEKGIRTLLDAFSRSGYPLKIVGDGPLRAEVEGFAQSNTCIEYTGPLEKMALFSLLRDCTALVFPSVWSEGMPMTIIEAFSYGIPVIASRTGVMETMISDGYNGIHFKAGDSRSLLNKLHQWRNLDPYKRTTFRRNALNTFHKQYTPEWNYQKLMALYQGVLDTAYPSIKKETNEKDRFTQYPRPHGQL